MIKFTLIILVALITSLQALAAGSYLEIFIVSPPNPIKWESPSTLFKSTIKNSITNDYAPNGHYIVHISTETPNRYGVTQVLTGMSRTDKVKTVMDTLVQGLGLTAMTQTFGGDLDAAQADIHELQVAQADNRLSSMRFPITAKQADAMMDFLEQWINYGSFRIYGGNKNVAEGEGSGCSDFANHFVNIAMNGKVPQEWIREVYLPHALSKVAPDRKDKRITILRLLTAKVPWGTSEEDGVLFSIPDPELMIEWIGQRSPETKRIVFPAEKESELKSNVLRSNYKIRYEQESEEVVKAQWKKISDFNISDLPQAINLGPSAP